MDVIEMVLQQRPDVEFAVLSGGPLRSNNQKYLDRAYKMRDENKLKIYEDLKKESIL